MRWFRNSWFARSVLFPLTLIMWASACTKTVIHTSPYDDIVREKPGGGVTVVLQDGTRMTVRRPRIVSDSLTGLAYNTRARSYTDTLSFAFAEMKSVEQVKTHPLGTILTVGAIVVPLVAIFSTDFGRFGCRPERGSCD
jgi:hypothetical protein